MVNISSAPKDPVDTSQDKREPSRRSRSPSPKRARSRSPIRDTRSKSPLQRETHKESSSSNSNRTLAPHRHRSPPNMRNGSPRLHKRSRSRSKSPPNSKKTIRCPECWKLHWGRCQCCKICGQRHYGRLGLKCDPFCNYCVKAGHTLANCRKKPPLSPENKTSSSTSSSPKRENRHDNRRDMRDDRTNSHNSVNWGGGKRDAPWDVDKWSRSSSFVDYRDRDRNIDRSHDRGPPPLTRVKHEGEFSSYAMHNHPSAVTSNVTPSPSPTLTPSVTPSTTSSMISSMTPTVTPPVTPVVTSSMTSPVTPAITSSATLPPNLTPLVPSAIGSGLNLTSISPIESNPKQVSTSVPMVTPSLPPVPPTSVIANKSSQINENPVASLAGSFNSGEKTAGTPLLRKSGNENFIENSIDKMGNVTNEHIRELSEGKLEEKLNETIEKGFHQFSATISELVTAKTSHIYEGIRTLLDRLSKPPVREDDRTDITIQESLSDTRRSIEELTNYVLEKTNLDATVHNLNNEIGKIEVMMTSLHNEMTGCVQTIQRLSDDVKRISGQQQTLLSLREETGRTQNKLGNGANRMVEEEEEATEAFITFL